MQLQDLINTIQSKGYLFQVSIPNTSFRHGRTSASQALQDSSSLKEYFERIAAANRAENLLVKLYTPNGSSFKNRGEHLIFFTQPGTVATDLQSATNSATQTTKALHGFVEPANSSHSMDVKDQINYEVLKIKHQMLEGVHSNLEAEAKILRKRVEDLHQEKLDLVKENSVNSERGKLEMDRALFNQEKQGKEGLAGIIGELKDDPELIKTIVGFIKPDHPMFKQEGAAGENIGRIEAPKYHTDSQLNDLLAELPNTIKDMDPQIISKIYMLFMKFAEKPETVDIVFAQLLPEHAKKKS